jgi:ribose transport system permease protein
LAGIPTQRTTAIVYVLCAALAGLAGKLLAAYSGGASLDMAADYLLMSIAVVVIGGTSIAGGDVAVAGLWGAALLLYLIVTMLNVLQVGSGLRYVLTDSSSSPYSPSRGQAAQRSCSKKTLDGRLPSAE